MRVSERGSLKLFSHWFTAGVQAVEKEGLARNATMLFSNDHGKLVVRGHSCKQNWHWDMNQTVGEDT